MLGFSTAFSDYKKFSDCSSLNGQKIVTKKQRAEPQSLRLLKKRSNSWREWIHKETKRNREIGICTQA